METNLYPFVGDLLGQVVGGLEVVGGQGAVLQGGVGQHVVGELHNVQADAGALGEVVLDKAEDVAVGHRGGADLDGDGVAVLGLALDDVGAAGVGGGLLGAAGGKGRRGQGQAQGEGTAGDGGGHDRSFQV